MKKIMIIKGLLLSSILVILDQLSKFIVIKYLKPVHSVQIIKDFFYFTFLENSGSFNGWFSNNQWVLIVITLIAFVIFGFMFKEFDLKNNKLYSIALVFIIGGTIGNFIDRIFRNGKVVDFIDFYIFNFNCNIFNIADICLCVGVALFCIYLIFFYDKKVK